MSGFPRAFAAMLRVNIANMIQYRAEILLWSVWGIVNPTVLYVMWASAAGGSDDGTVAGLDRNGVATYYFSIMIVGHVTAAWDVYEMSYLVRKGSLSPQLLRPILPIWNSITGNLAYKITTMMFVLPMWAVFFFIVRPHFSTQPWQFGLAAVALVLGAVLNYMMCYTVALIAFWATKLDAVGEIYFGLCMMLGGRVAPIAGLPPVVSELAAVLPFQWMFAFPAELLAGIVTTPQEAMAGLGMQAAWVALTIILFNVVWRAAIRRYSAVSG
ncbi:MAG: ABC-2 family transporter protein [Phycisphaerales bacterium]|nr:ABC-2 family transporter protein [Phycisphaerales bacterium]